MRHLPPITLKNAKHPVRWHYHPTVDHYGLVVQEFAADTQWGTRPRWFVIYNQTQWENPALRGFGLWERDRNDTMIAHFGNFKTLREAQEASHDLLRELFDGDDDALDAEVRREQELKLVDPTLTDNPEVV